MMVSDLNLLFVFFFNYLDDSLFNLVFYEMFYGFVNYDEDCLELFLFNFIDWFVFGNMFFNYVDFDLNFEFCFFCSNYIVEEEFNN